MRIAIDAMGGDHAPAAPVAGALRALEQFPDIEIVLVGDPTTLAEAAEHERISVLLRDPCSSSPEPIE